MQTGFTAIAAPIYQSRRLCSFVDVILKKVEVYAPSQLVARNRAARAVRDTGHDPVFDKALAAKLRPAHFSQFTGCGERLLANESGLLTNCQQAADTVRVSPQPHRCPKWWTAKERSFWPW